MQKKCLFRVGIESLYGFNDFSALSVPKIRPKKNVFEKLNHFWHVIWPKKTCSHVPVFSCSRVPVFPCSRVLVFPCSRVPVFPCSRVLVFPCSRVLVFPCSRVPVFTCSRVLMFPNFHLLCSQKKCLFRLELKAYMDLMTLVQFLAKNSAKKKVFEKLTTFSTRYLA